MRSAGRIRLGYFPLPVEEAQKIRALLLAGSPYAAVVLMSATAQL